jgi:hypothetical protein
VPSLAESLSQVMAVEGARAAALIDVATGMVVRSAGEPSGDFPAAAVTLADEARAARALSGPHEGQGDLDEILLVTGDRLQVSRMLGFPFAEGLLLFVDLDRTRVNMALASLRIGQLAPAVLA